MCRSTGTTLDTPPTTGIAAGEYPAVGRAVANRHDPDSIILSEVGETALESANLDVPWPN